MKSRIKRLLEDESSAEEVSFQISIFKNLPCRFCLYKCFSSTHLPTTLLLWRFNAIASTITIMRMDKYKQDQFSSLCFDTSENLLSSYISDIELHVRNLREKQNWKLGHHSTGKCDSCFEFQHFRLFPWFSKKRAACACTLKKVSDLISALGGGLLHFASDECFNAI